MISFDLSWGPVIAARAGTTFNPECDKVVCRVKLDDHDEEQILGGSIFTNYVEESIGIHVGSWAQNWVTRELLFVTFGYPFLQLTCNRLFGQVPANNEDALRFDLNLGFREVARVKGVYSGGVDCVVMCMEKSDCRFLRKPKGLNLSVGT